jgi:phospholipid/cholesterol/gamma-HCH transport system ATP-binding protein
MSRNNIQTEIIRVENLDVGYDGTAVLNNLDFAVQAGEITVVLGKSGCGKSTILKTLIGLMPPISGYVYFAGQAINYSSEHSLKDLYRSIGVLYQNSALLNSFTLHENISLPLRMHFPHLSKEIEREMVDARLEQVGLLQSRDKFPAELSGGMRKRAALARAMISDPKIIFCDEPSAGLDPITAAGLDELMLNLKNHFGITFLVVTHELRSIAAIADKALVLDNGGMHFFGPYHEMMNMTDPFIDSFFLKGADA